MAAKNELLHILIISALSIKYIEASFSRKNVEVFFDQPIDPNKPDNEYKPDDLISMIAIVSSEFTKISTGITDYQAAHPSTVVMPKAVALYNRFHLQAGESPLELSISFLFTEYLNGSGPPAGWDSFKEILAETNKIYPGTVKRIYLEHSHYKSRHWSDDDGMIELFEVYLASANFEIGPQYELGASLPKYFCTADSLPQVVRHIKHLSFEWWPNYFDLDSNKSTSNAVERLDGDFIDCQNIIMGYGKDISLRFLTGWLYLVEGDGPARDKELVEYWSAVNKWAMSVNSSVVLWEAFDIPDKFNKTKRTEEKRREHTGWWRLVPKSNYKSVSDYEFVGKRILPLPNRTGLISSIFWGFVVISVVLLIGIVALAFILLIARQLYPSWFYVQIARYFPDLKWFQL